jgi:hypothetical protein
MQRETADYADFADKDEAGISNCAICNAIFKLLVFLTSCFAAKGTFRFAEHRN